jgi:hypothetical protein
MSGGSSRKTVVVIICAIFFILFVCITQELYIINPFGH